MQHPAPTVPHIGSSVWPSATEGYCTTRPFTRGYVVTLHPLAGELRVGSLTLPPGAWGAAPLVPSVDPLRYHLTDPADVGRWFVAVH